MFRVEMAAHKWHFNFVECLYSRVCVCEEISAECFASQHETGSTNFSTTLTEKWRKINWWKM